MYPNPIKSLVNKQLQSSYQPVMELNRLVLTNLEQITHYQLESLKFYADFGLSQVQQLTQLENKADLESYAKKQSESLAALGQQLTADIQQFHRMNTEVKTALMRYMQSHSSKPFIP